MSQRKLDEDKRKRDKDDRSLEHFKQFKRGILYV